MRLFSAVVPTCALAFLAGHCDAQLIFNGGFETGDYTGWTTNFTPPNDIAVIMDGSLFPGFDLVRTGRYGVNFSVNETTPSAVISQSFSTVGGENYLAAFSFGTQAWDDREAGLLVEIVGADGITVLASLDTSRFGINPAGGGGGPADWSEETLPFTPDGATATIQFTDITPDVIATDALLDNVSVSTSPMVEWPVAAGGNGHRYQVVFRTNPTWFEARDSAALMAFNGRGGHLATFVTRAEQEFVIDALGGGAFLNSLWLGGYQDTADPEYSETDGAWKWITGEAWLGVAVGADPVLPRADVPFNNTYFTGASEEHLITWHHTGALNDYHHSPDPLLSDANGGPARGFIVEFDAACVADLNGDGFVEGADLAILLANWGACP